MQDIDVFSKNRPLIFSIAYRMLGSVSDAEDIVQETFLRWQVTEQSKVKSEKAFLSTIATRLCIDHLRSARVQRETYVGPWLPEPLTYSDQTDPEQGAELAESISTAFLLLLEKLTPTERAVFLLREVFDYDYADIAEIVGKKETNCRQIFGRARQQVAREKPRFKSSKSDQERIIRQFMQTSLTGDADGLIQLLTDEITLWTDGGGKVTAATRPVLGSANVCSFILGILRKHTGFASEIEMVNGQLGIVNRADGKVRNVLTFEIADNLIQAIFIVANPDKLPNQNFY